jgi:hypothetical protein
MLNKRVPVLNTNNQPLMPTKASRARRWIKEGKAKIVHNDLGIFQIQLLINPSNTQTQDISMGVDSGSRFTGLAVQSKYETLIGLNLNLPRKEISKRISDRARLRRTRRGRRIKRNILFKLRNHRQKRFNNRRKSKIPPSIIASKQLELRVIKELYAIYPITYAYVEMLTKYDTPSFSRAAQGQNWLVRELNKFTITKLVKGYETFNTRKYLGLAKSENKAEQSPDAHANDGVSLACRYFIKYVKSNLSNSAEWIGKVNVTKFDFLIVSRLGNRPRKMHDLTINKGGGRDSYGGFKSTHPYQNGDKVEYKTKKIHFIGIVSACDLYQMFPKRQRLKQGITNKNTRLISPSCNLLINYIKRVK